MRNLVFLTLNTVLLVSCLDPPKQSESKSAAKERSWSGSGIHLSGPDMCPAQVKPNPTKKREIRDATVKQAKELHHYPCIDRIWFLRWFCGGFVVVSDHTSRFKLEIYNCVLFCVCVKTWLLPSNQIETNYLRCLDLVIWMKWAIIFQNEM